MPHWSLLSSWLFLATPRKRNVGRHYRLDDLYSKIKDVATRCGFFHVKKFPLTRIQKVHSFAVTKMSQNISFFKKGFENSEPQKYTSGNEI